MTLQTVQEQQKNEVVGIGVSINETLLTEFSNSVYGTQTTKQTYIRGVRKFIKWLDNNDIQAVTIEHLEAYREYLSANYSVSSVNLYISSLKKFYDFLETHKRVPNIAKNLKGIKTNRTHKRDSLTLDQVKKIKDYLIGETLDDTGERNRVLFLLMLYTGLRTVEVERIKVEDIRYKGGKRVLYVQGKGHHEKDDFVQITKGLSMTLDFYINRFKLKPKSPLFMSLSHRTYGQPLTARAIREIIKNIYRAVGIYSPTITTHSIRHTAVTMALLGGATIQEVQAMARHSNINTTMIYAHNIDRLKDDNAESKLESYLDKV